MGKENEGNWQEKDKKLLAMGLEKKAKKGMQNSNHAAVKE